MIPASAPAPASPAPAARGRVVARLSPLWDAITSLRLTIVCMAVLMVLVVACTLAQVHLGTLGAVRLYVRSWLVWWPVPGTELSLPVFPGGAAVGLVLAVNLVAAQVRRMTLTWRKSGLWIAHAGLVLLVVGEFVTGVFQREDQLAFENGQTRNYLTSPREVELALVETGDPRYDDVHGVPAALLARGGEVPVPGTPVTLRVKWFLENSELSRLPEGAPAPATNGVGTGVLVRELPVVTRDDAVNQSSAVVEPLVGGASQGTWLVSTALGAPQSFEQGGRTWRLELRERREYLPYTLTLRKFSHDVYPGTDIPKNFSSLVHLSNPGTGEERDVLIRMNQPLRYAGKAFYQASFGKNDTLSILQVVENPGWRLPYVSCLLVTLGLLVHFAMSLARWARGQQARGATGGGRP